MELQRKTLGKVLSYEGDLEYTRKKIRQQAGVIQEHSSDGSAFAGCECIPAKHLDLLGEYATEGVSIATDPHEKAFYGWLAPWANETQKHVHKVIDDKNRDVEKEMWKDLADDMREVRRSVWFLEFHVPNPASKRAYLPRGLTEEEKASPEGQAKLARCIKHLEETQCPKGFNGDYSRCEGNPVAICRASVHL